MESEKPETPEINTDQEKKDQGSQLSSTVVSTDDRASIVSRTSEIKEKFRSRASEIKDRLSIVDSGLKKKSHGSDESSFHNMREINELISGATPSITELFTDRDDQFDPFNFDTRRVELLRESEMLEPLLLQMKKLSDDKAADMLSDMFEKYCDSQTRNARLVEQNRTLVEIIQECRKKQAADPKILKVLKIADRYRKENLSTLVNTERLERENFEMHGELKHLNENLRTNQKTIARCNRERITMKELAQANETLENKLMQTENQLNALKEKRTGDVFSEGVKKGKEETEAKLATERDRLNAWEAELTTQISNIRGENAELSEELLKRDKAVKALEKKIRNKDRQLKQAENKHKQNTRSLRSIQSKAAGYFQSLKKLQNDQSRLLGKISNLEAMVEKERKRVCNCEARAGQTQDALNQCQQQQTKCGTQLKCSLKTTQNLTQDLTLLQKNHGELKQKHELLQLSLSHAQVDLAGREREFLKLKNSYKKLKIQNVKAQDMMKLIHKNAQVMSKELQALEEDTMLQTRENMEISRQKDTLAYLLNQVIQSCHESEDKYRMLSNENQRNLNQLLKHERDKGMAQRKITKLMERNISLYSTTLSQAQVETMLRSQFTQIKKECDSLHIHVNDQVKKIDMMQEQDEMRLEFIRALKEKINFLEETVSMLNMRLEEINKHAKATNDRLTQVTASLDKSERDSALLRAQRDLLGSKLLQSKTEVELVGQRQRKAEQTMKNANVEYENMKNDLFILKLEVKNLRRKLTISEKHCIFNEQLKTELCKANKELQLERCKLSATVSQPCQQIHPWRKLLTNEPSKYELVIKIQKLTRALIKKTDECREKERLIFNKDYIFMQVRTLAVRKSNPCQSNELNKAKEIIRKQHRQLKALTSELNMKTEDLSRSQKVVCEQKLKIDTQSEALRKRHVEFAKTKETNKKKQNTHEDAKVVTLPKIVHQRSFLPQPPEPPRRKSN